MPLAVRLTWPSRKALLFDGSSHDSVPGTKVSYNCLAYSSEAMVSGEFTTTLPFSSTSLPPCDHSSQCAQLLPSPTAWPSAKPGGVPLAFIAWHSLRTVSYTHLRAHETRHD